ncbi:MAG: M1 family metallopeptidase [Chlorobi bacterium]|nr:M1 family metallopeptidase [Chlorobiota bacterium]
MKIFAFILLLLYSTLSITENIDEIIPPSKNLGKETQSGKIHKTTTVATENRDSIKIHFFIQPEHERHIERLKKICSLTLKFLSKNIGKYPYSDLSVVDIPKNIQTAESLNANAIVFDADYFLAKQSYEFEISIASKIASIYFGNIVKNISSDDAWLNYGLSRYIAHKVVEKNYPLQMNTFHLAGYLPIYGITFLSYNEIPIIYTLRYFDVPLESSSLKKYYENINSVPIAGNNSDALNKEELEVKNVHKPYLFMLSLDRYSGENNTLGIISEYYKQSLVSPVGKDGFIDILLKTTPTKYEFNRYALSALNTADKFDYAVDSLTAIGDNEFQIIASRKEAGVFPVEIFAYTEKDTLKFRWDGKSVHKKIIFQSNEKVIAAELDPRHKNIFDLNYANNSFMLEPDYTTSVSVAIRWFFWIQNAIIIIGSVG